MSFDDFKRVRKITDMAGTCHEGRDHVVEITGKPTNPVVACRTQGCTVYYYDKRFTTEAGQEQLTGKLRSASAGDGVECTFTITHDAAKKQILCEIDPDPNTTGSWTANDSGPGSEDGD